MKIVLEKEKENWGVQTGFSLLSTGKYTQFSGKYSNTSILLTSWEHRQYMGNYWYYW
jgi:hypothetical protein